MHIHSLHQLSFHLITKSTNSRKNGIQQILETTNGRVNGTKLS